MARCFVKGSDYPFSLFPSNGLFDRLLRQCLSALPAEEKALGVPRQFVGVAARESALRPTFSRKAQGRARIGGHGLAWRGSGRAQRLYCIGSLSSTSGLFVAFLLGLCAVLHVWAAVLEAPGAHTHTRTQAYNRFFRGSTPTLDK